MPKQRQGGDREATGWRQESEVAQIYWDRSPLRPCFSGHELRVGFA